VQPFQGSFTSFCSHPGCAGVPATLGFVMQPLRGKDIFDLASASLRNNFRKNANRVQPEFSPAQPRPPENPSRRCSAGGQILFNVTESTPFYAFPACCGEIQTSRVSTQRYSMRDEMRCFRSQSSNPKRERGRGRKRGHALPPSLTLRVTYETARVQSS
jgi:hypothetical protein